jgi:hypothetical protein
MRYVTFYVPCPELSKYLDMYYHPDNGYEPIAQDSYAGQILAEAVEYYFAGVPADKVIDMISSHLDDLSDHEVESFGEVFSTITTLSAPYIEQYRMSVKNTINTLRQNQVKYRSFLKLVDPNTLELAIEI